MSTKMLPKLVSQFEEERDLSATSGGEKRYYTPAFVEWLYRLLRQSDSQRDDLLAACKVMRATMYSDKSEESIIADAAIAKAAEPPVAIQKELIG